MVFLRVIFGAFAFISLCLILFVFGVFKSGMAETADALKALLLPGAFLVICSVIAGVATLKSSRVLSYITIALMAIVAGFAAWVPLAVGMHYHPDTNYTGWIIAFFGPIFLVAIGLSIFIHTHFKRGNIS